MDSSKNNVVITGSGGFIGLNTVKTFVNNGWKVFAIVHNNIPKELQNSPNIEMIKADITDKNAIEKALKNIDTSIIVHIAGLASDIGDDEKFRKLNFETVKNLAPLAKKKFIYISSTDVYGIKDFNGEDEDHLPFEITANNPYPKYKIESEKWLRANLDKSKYVIIRPAAVWGEGDKTLEKRVVDFLEVSPFIVNFGKWKGKNRWPLANVKNVATAIFQVAIRDDFNGEAINIIDDKRTSIDEYYKIVAKKYYPNKKFKTITLPFWVGLLIGLLSSKLSNFLKLNKPLFDPTYYAVHHVSFNLDFNGDKLKKLLGNELI